MVVSQLHVSKIAIISFQNENRGGGFQVNPTIDFTSIDQKIICMIVENPSEGLSPSKIEQLVLSCLKGEFQLTLYAHLKKQIKDNCNQ